MPEGHKGDAGIDFQRLQEREVAVNQLHGAKRKGTVLKFVFAVLPDEMFETTASAVVSNVFTDDATDKDQSSWMILYNDYVCKPA